MRINITRLWSSHGRGGPEGARPSGSRDESFPAEAEYAAFILFAHHRSRKFPPGRDICREQNFYNNHAFLQVQTLPMPSASAMLSHGPKRGQYLSQQPCFLTGLSAVSAASACERTALRNAKQQGAIATQSNGVERSPSGD